jgi:prefoldin subunit 5
MRRRTRSWETAHDQVKSRSGPACCAMPPRTVIDMAVAEHAPIAGPAFTVRRHGYDPSQVANHLNRLDAETTVLAADRAAAVEQANQLTRQLSACRNQLDAAHAEIDRLRGELRKVAETPDTVESMNNRLQVLLRLAREEFSGMRAEAAAHAAAYTADIIASVGGEAGAAAGLEFAEFELRRPRDESELEQLRRAAAAERSRLDEEAAARRAAADEEFRQVLALRCREAMAQLAKLQASALRSARRLIDDSDEQARIVLADAREAVRFTVDEAQREVDNLYELRQRLTYQIDNSRKPVGVAQPSGGSSTSDAPTAPDDAAEAPESDVPAGRHASTGPATSREAAFGGPALVPPVLPARITLSEPAAPGRDPVGSKRVGSKATRPAPADEVSSVVPEPSPVPLEEQDPQYTSHQH